MEKLALLPLHHFRNDVKSEFLELLLTVIIISLLLKLRKLGRKRQKIFPRSKTVTEDLRLDLMSGKIHCSF